MSYAYEIPDFTKIKIRQKSWAHDDAFWFMDAKGMWRNQNDRIVESYLKELFTQDDWEVATVVAVWDWVLTGIEIANPKNRVGKILQRLTEEDAPRLAYKIIGTERTMTPAAYAKRKPAELSDECGDWAGVLPP